MAGSKSISYELRATTYQPAALVYLSPMDYLLEVEGVRKAFPGVLALDDVSLRVSAGTVHALMGENGAGKSTLMNIVAGLLTPDAGDVRLARARRHDSPGAASHAVDDGRREYLARRVSR